MRQFYRCLSIVLAASFCATLLWTPPAAAEDAAAAAVQAAAANSGTQIAQANPFSDVPANSWAYDAVRQLAAAGLITGYPDNTFKGNRPMTRYEMAVLVNRAVNAIQSKIAGGGQVKQSDLDAIKKLVDAFGPELRQVQAQLRTLQQQQAALKTQADATKAEADAVKAANDQLKKQLSDDEVALRAATASLAASHPGYSGWYRGYTGSQQMAIGQAGAGVPAPTAATTAVGWGTLGGGAPVPIGSLARSFAFEGFRFNLSGAPDPRIQFGMRIESIIRTDQLQSGQVGTTGGYCTNPAIFSSAYNCQVQDYAGTVPGVAGANLPARVAYSWFGYFSPGGFFVKLGRIGEDEGRNSDGIALGGASANGVQIGYKTSRFYAYAFPNTQGTTASNLATLGTVGGNNSTNGLAGGAAAAGSGNAPTNLCPFGYPGNFPAVGGTPAVAGGSVANLATGTGAGYGAAADCVNQGSPGIAAMAEYYFPTTRTAIGFTYDGYNALPYNAWNPFAGLCTGGTGAPVAGTSITSAAGISTWNTAVVGANGYCPSGYKPLVYAPGSPNAGAPVTGAYQTIAANIKTSSVYGVQFFGPQDHPLFRLTGEYLWRYGNDPASAANPASGGVASAWKDNAYGLVELAYASKGNFNGGPLIPAPGIRGSNFVVLQYYNQGLNAQGLDNGVSGTLSQQSTTFYTNYAGTNEVALNIGRWFTNNFRAGFSYFVFSNRGIAIPASSPTCPTCTVTGLVTRAIGFDSYLVW
jgi:hypothetical protein